MINRVYLLLGPERGQKLDRIKEIQGNLNKEFGEEVEYSRFFAFDANFDDLFVNLTSSSLFSPHSLVVLHNIESLKAPQVNSILEYLDSVSKSSTFILESDETRLSSPSSKIATKLKENTTIFWGLQESQLGGWVKTFFRKAGLLINNEAVQFILEQVDNNTLELKIICNQLAFYYQVNNKKDTITEDEIESFVHHSKNETAFSLFANLATGKLKESLEIGQVLLERDNTSRYILVPGLLWCFRRLSSITEQLANGKAAREAFANASVMNKKNPVRNKRDLSTYSTAINIYSNENCNNIMKLLFEADITIRTASPDMAKLLVEQLIYNIVVNKGKKAIKLKTASLKQKL